MKFTTFVLIVILCLFVGKSQQENQFVEVVSDFFGEMQNNYFAIFNPQQISNPEKFEKIVALTSVLKKTDTYDNSRVNAITISGFKKEKQTSERIITMFKFLHSISLMSDEIKSIDTNNFYGETKKQIEDIFHYMKLICFSDIEANDYYTVLKKRNPNISLQEVKYIIDKACH